MGQAQFDYFPKPEQAIETTKQAIETTKQAIGTTKQMNLAIFNPISA